MIPLRVTLKGFMSYREEQTLLFDGASLHVLAGRNGAGKSTVFDAITYALYGVHRGGEWHADELINHQSDSLLVEVEFAEGDDVYYVRRTLSRKGRSSAQAFYVRGPAPPRRGAALPQALQEAASATALERWVEHKIGLNAATFCASVLLLQGKSEAMLEAKPAQRHEMLSQLVDLSAYQRLHERAKEYYAAAAGEAATHVKLIAGLPPVADEVLSVLVAQIAMLNRLVEEHQTRLRELAALRVHAVQWDQLTTEQRTLQHVADDAQVLLARAAEIRRDAALNQQLQRLVPLLEHVLEARQRLSECEQAIVQAEADAALWSEQFEGANINARDAKQAVESLGAQRGEASNQLQTAQRERLDLSPRLADVKALEQARAAVLELNTLLNEFPQELDQQLSAAEHELEQINELLQAFLWLQAFAKARAAWRRAAEAAASAEARARQVHEQIAIEVEEHQRLQDAVTAAEIVVGELQQRVTAAKTLLIEAKKATTRFGEIYSHPTCIYCGHELTPQHLELEQRRLKEALDEAQKNVEACRREHASALAAQQEATSQTQAQAVTVASLETELREEDIAAKQARRDQDHAVSRAKDALAALPERYRHQVNRSGAEEPAQILGDTFPTEAELAILGSRAATLAAESATVERLRHSQSERDQLRAQRGAIAGQTATLEAKYSPDRIETLRAAENTAMENERLAAALLDTIGPQLEEAERTFGDLEATAAEAERKNREAQDRVSTEHVRQRERARDAETRETEIPEEWRPAAVELTPVQLDGFRAQAQKLAGVPEALTNLEAAEREQDLRLARLKQIAVDLSKIPDDGRRDPEGIEEEERTITETSVTADKELQQRRNAHAELAQRRNRRMELETKRGEAARQAQRYRILADLLGKDNLQRSLLRLAERGIVDSANDVLDRVSNGALRIELRAQEDGIEGSAKALDLMAYNSATGGAAMPVYNLSGSQRFRVAVSLALGLGRWYADGGGHRVESVIIDEGFGSLDTEGRREMIDELHTLQDVLKRIILVSHQEEFSEAFKNGYTISLVNGTSVPVPI